MHKSSVYLPEQLKQSLSALAARSGYSEAFLIRRALERLVAVGGEQQDQASAPSVSRRLGPVLIGVGLGPGDPRHVTQLAKDSLTGADQVFAVSWTSHSIGRAEMLTRAVSPLVPVQRLVLDIMSGASGRRRSLVEMTVPIVAALDAGEVAVVVTLGDPSMWSIFSDIAAEVATQRPAVPVEMVPGVTSFQALAAATRTTLARTGQVVMIVDGSIPSGALESAATTLVVYKGAPDVDDIRAQVSAAGRLDHAIVGEMLGLPGQRMEPLEAMASGPTSYLATVIVPAGGTRS